MPKIFISYRREDTAGNAGHLAADLRERFGRHNVFIDIDEIAPGADFEVRIRDALDRSRVTFVLIGERWMACALADGTRRLDDDQDYVRREIAAALAREDVSVVPVLVEGATVPDASGLPSDIAALTKREASELSNKRWRYDVERLCRIARGYDPGWLRLWRSLGRRSAVAASIGILAVAAAVALLQAGGGTGRAGTSSEQGVVTPIASITPGSMHACDANISGNAVTSCPFAENVFVAYWRDYRAHGVRTVTAVSSYSPETKRDYRMSCATKGGGVDCSGGHNALVTFPLNAVQIYEGPK